MAEGFTINLGALQPSQLYISARKLATVEAAFLQAEQPVYAPVPVKRLDGR